MGFVLRSKYVSCPKKKLACKAKKHRRQSGFDSYFKNNVEQENQGSGGSFDRPMFKGDWKCAECQTAITELPFQPREGSEVYCRDCYRNKRPQRNFR